MAIISIKLIAEKKEYRPPTQSQIGKICSIPNFLGFSVLAVTAIKCCFMELFKPIQAMAFFKFNNVSCVVNDFEATINSVVAEFSSLTTSSKLSGSLSDI